MSLYDGICLGVLGLSLLALGFVCWAMWLDSLEPPYAPPLSAKIAAKLDSSPRIVNNWRNAWRWTSVRAMGLSSSLLTAWELVPDDIRSKLPHWCLPAVVVVVLVLGMLGRVVVQVPKDGSSIPDDSSN